MTCILALDDTLWHFHTLMANLTACSSFPGVKIIFRVGLVLLKYTLGSSEKLKSCQGQYETMERLRALNPKIMQETFLVQEVRWEWGLAPASSVGFLTAHGCKLVT